MTANTWHGSHFIIYFCSQIHTIAIIAEGIPEAQTRRLIKMADEKGVTIIGPATVCTHISYCQQRMWIEGLHHCSGHCVFGSNYVLFLRSEGSSRAVLRSATRAACWTTSWLLNCIVPAALHMCRALGVCPTSWTTSSPAPQTASMKVWPSEGTGKWF